VDRITGLEGPASAPAGAPRAQTGARLERFGPEPEPTLELVDAEGRRPFIRCRRCGMDNSVFATACQGCSVSLDTPEQREFDERFWTARNAQADREARDAAARRKLQARAEEQDAPARRAMAEAMAREAGERERRRLDASPGSGSFTAGTWSPLGLRLARLLISDERWHAPAVAMAAALCVALAGYGVHVGSPFLGVAGAVAMVLVLVNAPG
jgi:hypothetical protein